MCHASRAGQPSRGTAGLVRGVLEQYAAGGACPEPVEGTPEDARLPAPLPARRAYRPEGRAYSSERRTIISAVAVTPGRDEISGLERYWLILKKEANVLANGTVKGGGPNCLDSLRKK